MVTCNKAWAVPHVAAAQLLKTIIKGVAGRPVAIIIKFVSIVLIALEVLKTICSSTKYCSKTTSVEKNHDYQKEHTQQVQGSGSQQRQNPNQTQRTPP